MMMRHADARLRIALAIFWVIILLGGMGMLMWQSGMAPEVLGSGFVVTMLLLSVFLIVVVKNTSSQKRKNDDIEKPKRRDQTYTVGDDGELHLIEELENTPSQRS